MLIFFWLLFVYLFSSIPNGYLIVKWISGKDIRKIGRQKISGSNIIHNVGKGPGILSGAFDILKGVIATAGAYFLGLPPFYQALAGVLAVCGQMWPVFLKFWGGRGGGTSIGAMLGLNPILALSVVIIWILTKLISKEMGAAIGMINFYIISGIVGFYFKWPEVYIFSFLTLFLVLAQRLLGRPGSIFEIKDKKVFLWRLFLDRDTKKRMKAEKKTW